MVTVRARTAREPAEAARHRVVDFVQVPCDVVVDL